MSASRRFHSRYRETIRVADQRPLQVRLIRPTDKPKLAKAFHHLSAESRYYRFLGHKNALTPQELRFFTEWDGIDHLAFRQLIRLYFLDRSRACFPRRTRGCWAPAGAANRFYGRPSAPA